MLSRRNFLKQSLGSVAFLTSGAVSTMALAGQKHKPVWLRSGKVAANGYDVVAYFTKSKPVRGNKSHSMVWQGAEWRFSSAGHLAKFKANPVRYAPQYGGHCAYAMSKGYIASTVPEAWSVVKGKLYLNYSTSVRSLWNKNISGHIKNGNANWPSL